MSAVLRQRSIRKGVSLSDGAYLADDELVDGTLAKAGAFPSKGNPGVIHETCDNHARRRCYVCWHRVGKCRAPLKKHRATRCRTKVKGSLGASGYAPGHENAEEGFCERHRGRVRLCTRPSRCRIEDRQGRHYNEIEINRHWREAIRISEGPSEAVVLFALSLFGDVRFWPLADITIALPNVPYGQKIETVENTVNYPFPA